MPKVGNLLDRVAGLAVGGGVQGLAVSSALKWARESLDRDDASDDAIRAQLVAGQKYVVKVRPAPTAHELKLRSRLSASEQGLRAASQPGRRLRKIAFEIYDVQGKRAKAKPGSRKAAKLAAKEDALWRQFDKRDKKAPKRRELRAQISDLKTELSAEQERSFVAAAEKSGRTPTTQTHIAGR